MRVTRQKLLTGIVVCTASACFFGGIAALATPPTGDPEAIELNQQVQQTYSKLPGVKVVQRGLL